MIVVGDEVQSGIFYANSRTSHSDILDGSTNTILVGERSKSTFHSTWTGVVEGANQKYWRVVGWTNDPPNFKRSQPDNIDSLGIPQFNSVHLGGMVMFAFADGSVRPLDAQIDPEVFRAMGTINGRE